VDVTVSDLLGKGKREKSAFEQKTLFGDGRENEEKERALIGLRGGNTRVQVLNQSDPGIDLHACQSLQQRGKRLKKPAKKKVIGRVLVLGASLLAHSQH
jgi:hypothetical protein